MHMFRRLPALLLALVVLLSGTIAFATPTDYVKKKTEIVTSVLQKPDSKKRQDELHKILKETIDFGELAARALGEHWTKRTDAEREEFLALLQDMLQANYEGKLEGHTLGKDYTIEYKDEKVKDDKAIVKTSVVTKEGPKPVEYKLLKKGDTWTIWDVVIDDVSLEETYRESYTEIIEKEGWPALIQRMKDKAKEIRAQAKKGSDAAATEANN